MQEGIGKDNKAVRIIATAVISAVGGGVVVFVINFGVQHPLMTWGVVGDLFFMYRVFTKAII